MNVTDVEVRCPECNRILAEYTTRPWRFRCPRCKSTVEATADEDNGRRKFLLQCTRGKR